MEDSSERGGATIGSEDGADRLLIMANPPPPNDFEDEAQQHPPDDHTAEPENATSSSTSTIATTTTPAMTEDESSAATVPRILRAALPSHSAVYTLAQFLQQYVPTLPPLADNNIHDLWRDTLIVVDEAGEQLAPLEHHSRAKRYQSHASLVQDLIDTLVLRRRTNIGNHSTRSGTSHAPQNLLAQGFGLRSSKTQVHQCQWNAAADYVKTAPQFLDLHQAVGCDVMRYLLQNTRLFRRVTTSENENDTNNNYWQLTGTPVGTASFSLTNQKTKPDQKEKPNNQKKKKKKRRRPIRQMQWNKNSNTQTNNPLAPDQCVSRVGLFYSAQYTARVGDRLLVVPPSTTESPGAAALWSAMTAEYRQCLRNSKNNSNITTTAAAVPPPPVPDWCHPLLPRHARLDYPRLLERHCPLPHNYQNLTTLAELARQHVASGHVLAFVRASLARWLPLPQFWGGDPKNEHAFFREILTDFLQLRRREQFTNRRLLRGLRVTQMPWLFAAAHEPGSRVAHERAKLLLLSVLRWIFRHYLIPLLAQAFYVTEASELNGMRVLYYRQPVWSRFRSLAMQKLLLEQYTEVSEADAAARLAAQQMGLSELRLMPKATGVRPIATLRKPETMWVPVVCGGGSSRSTVANANDNNEEDDNDDEMDTPFGPARKKRKTEHPLVPKSLPQVSASGPRPPRVPLAHASRQMSTNAMLGDAFAVLSYEYQRQKHTFGSGLMGLHHFYPRYRQFLQEWNESHSNNNNHQKQQPPPPSRPRLFFGSVDIRHCYDNIDQDHLLQLVEQQILTAPSDEYVIQKYSVLHPVDDDDDDCAGGRVRHRRCRDVTLPEEMNPFGTTVQVLAERHSDCIFVDGVNYVAIGKRAVMDQLREHLTRHMVVTQGRFGKRYLLQSKGIPQGSILSTLLCNFYYGDVERRLLGGNVDKEANGNNNNKPNLIARMVDDFIMVTTDVSDLERFFTKMYRGDPNLGVEINQEKTCSSIQLEIRKDDDDDDDDTQTISASSTSYFPWCGMLFDTATGQVRNDYSRFAEIQGRDSLTVQRVRQEGVHLLGQMKLFVRPRCLPILFDPFINTLTTQVVNFYQMMVFAAVKTAEYLKSMSPTTTNHLVSSKSAVLSNVPFLMGGIQTTMDFAYSLIESRLRKAFREMNNAPELGFRGLLKADMAVWLGWRAFYDTFRQLPGRDFRHLAVHHLRGKAQSRAAAWHGNSNVHNGKSRAFWEATIVSALRDMALPTLIDVQSK